MVVISVTPRRVVPRGRVSINGAGLVTGGTIDLNAVTGIGNTTALELSGAAISADTTGGNIDLNNAIAATYSSLTTGTGSIIVDNTGAATFTTATTTDGLIDLETISGNLTVGTSVTAGGSNKNVTLTTTTSGNVILTGTTTAADDTVTVTSAGSINGAGLVTGWTIDLNAVTGIGNTTALELTGSSISAETTFNTDLTEVADLEKHLAPLGLLNTGVPGEVSVTLAASSVEAFKKAKERIRDNIRKATPPMR